MVSPMLAVSGGIAVLQLCKEIYLKYKSVKRFRDDCKKLAHFVHRVEGFLMETEDEADMTGPGWQAAFTALHESLVEVSEVFDDCARFGIVRSLINADEVNLRLSSIAQRMTMALQLIPIQKAKVTDRRLGELQQLQAEMRTAQFAAARAAEQQSAQLKRLMDQSRVDASKTQEMLAQVLQLLQADASTRTSAAAAAGPGPAGGPAAAAAPAAARAGNLAAAAAVVVSSDQLEAEVQDLKAEMVLAQRDKNVLEEQYLAQIIAAIEAMEVNALEAQHRGGSNAPSTDVQEEVPSDLLCPITRELLEDPVILVDSHQTYERAAIKEWLGRGNTKDPITGIQLQSSILVPNVLVRKLANEWLEQHPSYRKAAAEASAAAATVAPQAAAAAVAAAAVDVPFKKPAFSSSSSSGSCGFSAEKAVAALSGNFTLSSSAAVESSAGGCSSSKGKPISQLQLERHDSHEFKPNPRTEAVLAAVQSNMFDPAVLFSKSLQLQREYGLNDKAAAQRAYAATIAEAAAAAAAAEADEGQEVAVYSVFRGSSGGAGAHGGSRRVDLQPLGPAVPLPAGASAYGTTGAATASAAAAAAPVTTAAAAPVTPAAAAAAYATTGGVNVRDHDLEPLYDQVGQLSLLEQQQRQRGQRYLQHAQSYRPSMKDDAGEYSRQLYHSSSAAARPRDTVTLEDFRATFGHVAQTRTHIAMKHGTQMEKIMEADRAQRAQQLRQETEWQHSAGRMPSYEAQHRLQQLQEEEECQYQNADVSSEHEYYHHQQQQQQRRSLQPQQSYHQRHDHHHQQQQQMFEYQEVPVHREASAPAAVYRPSGSGSGSSGSASLPPTPGMSINMCTQQAAVHVQHAHSMPVQAHSMPVQAHSMPVQAQSMPVQAHSMPVQANRLGSAVSSAAAYMLDQAVPRLPAPGNPTCSTSSARSFSSSVAAAAAKGGSSSSSRWSFGRKKSSKPGDDAAFDDTASVSSDGSMASKRSMGKGMMSVLKNISYSIKYDDEKC